MEIYNNINEINRYNFKYEINKSIQNYEFPNNNLILEKQQKFYDIRKNYKNNILYKYFFGGINGNQINFNYVITKFGDQKKNSILTLSYIKKKVEPNTYIINSSNLEYDNLNQNFKNKKFNLIIGRKFLSEDLKNLNVEERIKYQFNQTITKIKLVLEYLNDGGYFFFNIFGYDSRTIKLIHLLLLLFNRILFHRNFIICQGFNMIINKEKLFDLFTNIDFVKIDPLLNLTKISAQRLDDLEIDMKIIKTIKDKDLDEYFNITNNVHFNETIEFQILNKNKNIDVEFEKELYENLKLTSVSLDDGIAASRINPTEGNFIYDTIIKNNFSHCLEIGMNYGISSMYILLALKKNINLDKKLVSVDKNQLSQWKNFGINLVKSIKMNKYHTLYDDESYKILPELIDKKEVYDFIFIEGWKFFDYTLLDLFYSNLLLKVGGIIMIDDAYHQGINKCIKYIDANYKHFKRIQSPLTIAAYQKISDDNRSWDYHINF